MRYDVVVLVGDDWPADWFDEATIPWLSTRPDGHWVRFTNATAHDPLCGPSRAAMFTGRYGRHNGVTAHPADDTIPEVAQLAPALRKAGYTTGLFGKWLNGWQDTTANGRIPAGWDRWYGSAGATPKYYGCRAFDQGTSVTLGTEDPDYSTDVFFSQAVDWINDVPLDRPYMAWIAPHSTHDGDPPDGNAIPATRHAALALTPEQRPNFNEADISDKPAWLQSQVPDALDTAATDAIEATHLEALRCMASVDEGLEALRDALVARGTWDRTIVIIQSDQCNLNGEHRLTHKTRAYEECLVSPMWIRHPDAPQADKVHLVENVDIAPTIAAAAGARLPIAPDGQSLLPLLVGDVPWRSMAFHEHPTTPASPPWRAVRTATHKYVEYTGGGAQGQTELYDLVNDPYELVNVTSDPSFAATKSTLAAALETLGA